jgi:chemotaxis protein methyltransferase CheR
MNAFMTDLTISDTDFGRFRDFFYQRTGIFFEDNKHTNANE